LIRVIIIRVRLNRVSVIRGIGICFVVIISRVSIIRGSISCFVIRVFVRVLFIRFIVAPVVSVRDTSVVLTVASRAIHIVSMRVSSCLVV
jgi:hypothetical protein